MHDRAEQPDGSRRRTLVTGGAGFIGSHLVDALIDRGDHVTVVDDLSTGSSSNLASTGPDDPRLEMIESTVTDAVAGPLIDTPPFDEIHHLAASVGVVRILERPTESIETNIHETSALLRFAVERHPRRLPRVLLASSSEVYGLGGRGELLREDDTCTYGPTTAHRWSYGYAKAIDEFLALAHHREDGLPIVIVRLFNIVGPRQSDRYGMVLPRFVKSACAGEDLLVHGDGTQVRTFCDVRDIVGPLIQLAAHPDATGRVVNIGSDSPLTVSNLAQRVVDCLDSVSRIRTIPYREAYADGFQDLPHRCPALDRLRELVDFSPTITLEQTIRDIAKRLAHDQVFASSSRAAPQR